MASKEAIVTVKLDPLPKTTAVSRNGGEIETPGIEASGRETNLAWAGKAPHGVREGTITTRTNWLLWQLRHIHGLDLSWMVQLFIQFCPNRRWPHNEKKKRQKILVFAHFQFEPTRIQHQLSRSFQLLEHCKFERIAWPSSLLSTSVTGFENYPRFFNIIFTTDRSEWTIHVRNGARDWNYIWN